MYMDGDGFEPPKGVSPPDLQSGAIDRSATRPINIKRTSLKMGNLAGSPFKRNAKTLIKQKEKTS